EWRVERREGAGPIACDIAGGIHAPVARKPGRWGGELHVATRVGAFCARPEPVRRVVDIAADREPVRRGPGGLAVDLPHVAVFDGELTKTEIRRADSRQGRVGVEQLGLTRVPVVHEAEIE